MLINNIDFNPQPNQLMQRLHIKPGSVDVGEFMQMLSVARSVARPKALLQLAYIDQRADGEVIINGVVFRSRVLAKNISNIHRVFAYVATCGNELADWAAALEDPLLGFWSDVIQEEALSAAIQALSETITKLYQPGQISSMNPGSLEDWPISEQRQLFTLLGDVKSGINVELTESLLMVPMKSVSGIYFPSEANFQSCQLCPRENCTNRRAVYDPSNFEKLMAS